MSDNMWRKKKYYPPRILLDLADLTTTPLGDALLCLTGSERGILQNLLDYANRRSTWVSEYQTDYYLAPTEEEWDNIQAAVAELEDKLMNCDAFTAQLEAILEAAQCACEGAGSPYTDAITGPIYESLEGDGTIAWVPDDGTPVPGVDDRCALAQLIYQMNYEILTEYLQPLQTGLHNVLLPIVIAGIAVLLGGPVGLVPGATLYAFINAALDAWVEGELQNVENGLISIAYDVICAMYLVFVDSGDYAAAAAAAQEVIDDCEAFSAIDKALFHATFSPWVMSLCQDAWTAQSDWAVANVEAGYCEYCATPPVIGNDWWALPLLPGENTVIMNHTVGGYWLDGCWQHDRPTGKNCCGSIFEVTVKTGGCQLKRMGAGEAGCTGCELSGNTGDNLTTLTYFAVNGANIDEANCKAALAPGSTTLADVNRCTTGTEVNQGFNLGWSCTDYVEIVFKYMVFEGTSP